MAEQNATHQSLTLTSILCNARDIARDSFYRSDLRVSSQVLWLRKEIRGESRALSRLWRRPAPVAEAL